jgi:hypothetical protein
MIDPDTPATSIRKKEKNDDHMVETISFPIKLIEYAMT